MSRRRSAADAATTESPTADEIVQGVADSTHIPDEHANGHSHGHAENDHVSALDRLKARSAPKQSDKQPMADPHYFEAISLTEKNDGPKLRLGRSNRHKEMLIRFDSKPEGEVGEAIFTALKDGGFRWNRDAQAWALKLDPLQKFRAHQAAEAIFKDIANTLREQNGLPPVSALGQGVA